MSPDANWRSLDGGQYNTHGNPRWQGSMAPMTGEDSSKEQGPPLSLAGYIVANFNLSTIRVGRLM